MSTGNPLHVVIVGGGFAGLAAARGLNSPSVRITLIDRRNFHLFQPLLYQVATGGLSPANIAAPLRGILRRQVNTRVLLGEVADIDIQERSVCLADGARMSFDTLIVATGATHNYFGNDAWADMAPGLKSIEDATTIRRRILLAFEEAERLAGSAATDALLTFVVVGAGPTGVELAGALAEIAHDTLRKDFRAINPASARVILVDAADRILPAFPPELSTKAAESLDRLGVSIRLRTTVAEIQPDHVRIRSGDATETIPARTVLWAAGVQASPLGRVLAERTGATLDRAGRVQVSRQLFVPGHSTIFVLGDLAAAVDERGKPLPGIAPVAMQQGRFVAKLIRRRLTSGAGATEPEFRYVDRGIMATIGRAAAVADLGWAQFSGLLAWLLWLFIHLMALVAFQNRVLVLAQWAWNYITWSRSARLITDTAPDKSQSESGMSPLGAGGQYNPQHVHRN